MMSTSGTLLALYLRHLAILKTLTTYVPLE
jgi:hypothetical protein